MPRKVSITYSIPDGMCNDCPFFVFRMLSPEENSMFSKECRCGLYAKPLHDQTPRIYRRHGRGPWTEDEYVTLPLPECKNAEDAPPYEKVL